MTSSFLPFTKHSITENDIQAVTKSLTEEILSGGPIVEKLEDRLAYHCGARYAVAFSSGTAAKLASFFAAELTGSDWIITSPNTCLLTVGPAIQMKNRILLVDTDPQTGNMDLNLLKNKLKTQTTRGRPFILACHFAGMPLEMQSLDHLICHPETVVIEDASYAFGSCYSDGLKVGSCAYSQMTVFSFQAGKMITTGEGGMVTTNDYQLYKRLKLYRNNGIDPAQLKKPVEPWFHEYQAITGNYTLTEFQAALGLSQFKRLNELIKRRIELMYRYRQGLRDLPHTSFCSEEFDAHTAWQLCVIQIDFEALKKDKLSVMKKLKDKGISTKVHYCPLYQQPLVGPLLNWEEEYPQNDLYYARTLSLPFYHDLKEEEIDYICRELRYVLGNTR